jgi:putative transposase
LKVQRVERHIIKNDKEIDHICFLSKNLYNYCNFILRQLYLKKLDELSDFSDLIKKIDITEEKFFYTISEYDLSKRLGKLNQVDYKVLPSQTSQQVIKILYKNWKSFFKAIVAYHKNKSKFKGLPKLPNYKHKETGRNIIVFTNQQIRRKGEFLLFPKKLILKPIKTAILIEEIAQVRIVPKTSCYVLEVVYNKEIEELPELNSDNILAIDIGINNLATCVNNTGETPFIVNGKIVKSINQYYNKKLVKLQSFVGDKGTSKRIKKLCLKRNNKLDDYFHKASRYIIDYCLEHKIKTIVCGYNKDWKTAVNLGSFTNQKFVQIPFTSLLDKLKYKADEVGMNFILNEESYTSKCSFLDLEEISKHDSYAGKRIKRGLFRSSNGTLINADVNGAFNIMRKVIPNSLKAQGIQGVGLHPIIVRL